nr:PAS domain-containing protein [Smithellaceae bacterium]
MELETGFFENVSFSFAILDKNLSVKAINNSMAELLQSPAETIIGRNIYTLIKSLSPLTPDTDHFSQYINLNTGQSFLIDVVKIAPEIYCVFCQNHSPYDQMLEQVAIISKKKIISDKMLDCLYDGCYITDGNGETLFVNDAFLEMSGLTREEIVGKSVKDMLVNKMIPKSCTVKVLETGKPASMIIDYYKGRSCLVTGAPVYIDGKIERVICTSRDMTELSAMKDKLA